MLIHPIGLLLNYYLNESDACTICSFLDRGNSYMYMSVSCVLKVSYKDCQEISDECKNAGVLLAVCHVLRYAPESIKLKELIDSGTIGEVVSIQLMEPVDIRRRRGTKRVTFLWHYLPAIAVHIMVLVSCLVFRDWMSMMNYELSVVMK